MTPDEAIDALMGPRRLPAPAPAPAEGRAGRVRAPYVPSDRDEDQPPGGFSWGTNILGGSLFSDPFQSKRAPSPWQLVENYRGLPYAMVARKMDAVSKIPLRLMCDGSRKALGGKPRGASDPIRVPRHLAVQHARSGMISRSAVDEVFEIRNHPILDVLDNPDPYENFDRQSLIALLVAFQEVVGQAFLIPDGNGWNWRDRGQKTKKGIPEYLWIIYSQFVVPYREGESPIITAWQYFRDYLPKGACLWFRKYVSLRDPYGSAYSPLYAGEMYRSQEERFIAIYDQVYALGPRPSLIASAKDPNNPPGEAERRRHEQDLQRRHAAGNAGGVLVTTGAFDYTPMNYAPADLGGKELGEYDRCNLATIMGLPPTYFTTETNLANLEAADAYFARFGVEPMCQHIAGVLTRLVRKFDPRLYFQFDPVLADDELKKAQVDKIYADMGARTINEINQELKYDAKPYGDLPYISKNLVRIDMLDKMAEQGLASQQAAMESQKRRDDFELVETPEGEGEPVEEEAEAAGDTPPAETPEEPAARAFSPAVARALESELAFAETLPS